MSQNPIRRLAAQERSERLTWRHLYIFVLLHVEQPRFVVPGSLIFLIILLLLVISVLVV